MASHSISRQPNSPRLMSLMRLSAVVIFMGLAACVDTDIKRDRGAVAHGSTSNAALGASMITSSDLEGGPFAGTWMSCHGDAPQEECGRYDLVQRGPRICGTWSYVASSSSYEGRVIAQTTSDSLAKRTHVCGRPGSETNTECDRGWQSISSPLQLCDGRLSDRPLADGSCTADYSRMSETRADLRELAASAWVQECLGSTLPD